MAPREGCPLRSGDWCSRLSWPGTPVTSFRWGRVTTITVSPGGAASPARRDAPRRSSGIPCVRTAPPGSVAGAPCRPSATPCAQSGEPGLVENAPRCCPARPRAGNRSQSPSRPRPRRSMRADSRPLDPSPAHPTVLLPLLTHGRPSPRVVENAPEATSTAPAGADRTPQAASSSPGHPHPAGRHLRRGHSTWPGACHPGRGHSTPSGTAIPSPNAQDVPGRTEMSPHAQDVPSRDARVWGIRGIPSHWCSECADVQPRPPGPTQAPEAARQCKTQPAPGEGRLPAMG